MSKADQFWLYARQAVLFAGDSETDQEKQTLFDLARIWTRAALSDRASSRIKSADLRPEPHDEMHELTNRAKRGLS
jgi:hypothetical protein